MRKIDQADINSFLRLGYFLKYRNPTYSLDLTCGDKTRYCGADTQELVDIGIEKFKGAIERRYCTNQEHVVPLSGGLDSRAILAALLEHTEARHIRTYTFGTPGTYDYDIGNAIARVAGTTHLHVPLTEYQYKIDNLIAISRRVDHQTILFHHPCVEKIDEYCAGRHVWSGALMETLFGSHYHEEKASDWDEARRNFIREQCYSRSVKLTDVPDEALLDAIEIDNRLFGRVELELCLDMLNRQLKFIFPHVLMKGYQYKVLFDDKDLVAFALSIDERLLKGQTLYKMMLLKAFPKLFRLRTKTADGLPLTAGHFRHAMHKRIRRLRNRIVCYRTGFPNANPHCNYIDFSRGLRERSDLRHVVFTSIQDLKRRGVVPWIDVDAIWEQHMSRKANYSNELIVLASLELHFKAGLRWCS